MADQLVKLDDSINSREPIQPKRFLNPPISELAIKLRLEAPQLDSDPVRRFWEHRDVPSFCGVPKPLQTAEMLDAALAADSGFTPILKSASKKILDHEKCLEACRHVGSNLKYVPKRLIDYEICLAAVSSESNVLRYVPDNLIDEKLLLAAARCPADLYSSAFGEILKHIDLVSDQKSFFRLAVEENPCFVGHVPYPYRTDELIWLAVKSDPLALEAVPAYQITPELAAYAVEHTEAGGKDWPISYVPEKMLRRHLPGNVNRLVTKSLDIDPMSIAGIPEAALNVKTVKTVISAHPECYRFLSESFRSKPTVARLAVKLDSDSIRFVPETIKGKIDVPADVDTIGSAVPFPESPVPRPLEEETDGNEGLIARAHDLVRGADNLTFIRPVHYITDIHVGHQLDLVGLRYEAAVNSIRSKTDDLASSIPGGGIFLFGGDIAPSPIGLKAFMDAFNQSTAENCLYGPRLLVLGNHELWHEQVPGNRFGTDELDNSIAEYRAKCNEEHFRLLENDLYIEYKDGRIRILDEAVIAECTDGDLSRFLHECRLIVLGGCGYCARSNGIHVDLLGNGSFDLERSERFRKIYNKLNRAASDLAVIVFTHYPMRDWSSDNLNQNWIYISGHTHRNVSEIDPDRPIVLEDGQIGYRQKPWRFRTLSTDAIWDPYSKLGDGIYEVDSRSYEDFNRGRAIQMQPFTRTGSIYMVKRAESYMFFHRSSDGGSLHLLVGGSIRNLEKQDLGYYFENLHLYVDAIRFLFAPYVAALGKISEEVRNIGGDGYIHGCIVDIDWFNHIYLDPLDGKASFYYATDTTNRVTFKNAAALISKSPCIDENVRAHYRTAIGNGEISLLPRLGIEKDGICASVATKTSGSSMYNSSRIMKSIQYAIENGVVRIWNEDVLKAFSPRVRSDLSSHGDRSLSDAPKALEVSGSLGDKSARVLKG